MNQTTAIEVESLSKRYIIGRANETHYKTIRDGIGSFVRSPFPWNRRNGHGSRNEVWALRDVNFQVQQGEALGIIGRNGAGKSTLLKILSKITEPTSGRARLRGRVASLLEVGTGFHPELTGRENIYLNGAILGMTRAEIKRDFDAIVAFAEIEKFLDTPVKRYSSGMYVRLAFAVAAHLTPEILMVDEVLAVGDYEFQRRCLGRMNSVAKRGRTVLFVSHNMAAIEDLCPRTLLLNSSRVEKIGPSSDVIAHYLSLGNGESLWDFSSNTEREGTGRAKILRVELLSEFGNESLDAIQFGRPFRVRIHYDMVEQIPAPRIGLALLTEKDERVFLTETAESNCEVPARQGPGQIDCLVRSQNILPGSYRLELWIVDVPNVSFADHLRMVGKVEVVVGDWRDCAVAGLSYHDRGRVYIPCQWHPHSAVSALQVQEC
jgi:lipopolysaccharide transport system ATP-binding protein